MLTNSNKNESVALVLDGSEHSLELLDILGWVKPTATAVGLTYFWDAETRRKVYRILDRHKMTLYAFPAPTVVLDEGVAFATYRSDKIDFVAKISQPDMEKLLLIETEKQVIPSFLWRKVLVPSSVDVKQKDGRVTVEKVI